MIFDQILDYYANLDWLKNMIEIYWYVKDLIEMETMDWEVF
jgi:hypothetical protein